MNYRRNVFHARPKKFRGRESFGVAKYPGFHTTDRYSVACVYADMKTLDLTPNDQETGTIRRGWRYPISDYPVIVSLVMNGLQRLPDYDAFEYWSGPIAATLEEFAKYHSPATVEEFADFAERGFEDGTDSDPGSAHNALAEILDGYPGDAVAQRILDWLNDQPEPEDALDIILREPDNPVFLMHICKQYRYLDDVSEKRICAVDYMKPFFDKLLPHPDDPEWERDKWDKRVENIEAAGYAVVSLADVYDDRDPTVTTNVYSVPPESIIPDRGQALMPWGEHKPRVEHHGTSYVNLCRAAPALMRGLPVPPEPYRKES